MAEIILKAGREHSVERRHPWIFSGAIQKTSGEPADGDTVEIRDSNGRWLARGSYSVQSQIKVRLLTFNKDEQIDEAFWKARLYHAIEFRKGLEEVCQNDAFRLIYAESDGLPGVIVDRYGEYLICQFSSSGAERWKDVIVRMLSELWPCRGIFERSDTESRGKEGHPPRVITLGGSPPPPLIQIRENDSLLNVNVYKGHKTGFYLDQSINRKKITYYCRDRYVLNAFCYTGGFGIAAAQTGATLVSNVDISEEILNMARDNFMLNNLLDNTEFFCEDVFKLFRTFRDSRRQFDMIILDPPKFVASASQLTGGARGYKDINLLAFKLLRPGGILVTFSCSGYIRPELFQKIVSDAAVDAGINARILEYLFQAPDHPVSLAFPEGLYLKGLICKVD